MFHLKWTICEMPAARVRWAAAAAAALVLAAAGCCAAATELVPIPLVPSNYPNDPPNYSEYQACTQRGFPGRYFLDRAICGGQYVAIVNENMASARALQR